MGKRKYDKLIAEKCFEDTSEYIWFRLEVWSVLIYKSKSVNWIVFREKSGGPEMSVIWCRSVRSFIGNVKYDRLIAEKRIEDASEYIWLRF